MPSTWFVLGAFNNQLGSRLQEPGATKKTRRNMFNIVDCSKQLGEYSVELAQQFDAGWCPRSEAYLLIVASLLEQARANLLLAQYEQARELASGR